MQDQYYMGVDVGGTKTEVCLLSIPSLQEPEKYRLLHKERVPTDRQGDFPNFIRKTSELIRKVLTQANTSLSKVTGIGMGIPGSVDPQTYRMMQGNVSFLKDQDLTQAFRDSLQYSGHLLFENDANCFALAEAYFGAGRTWANQNKLPLQNLCMIGIILGTGVGGGLIVDGKIVRGRRGGAGEIGHLTLVESGRPCYCGKFGCAEQYLSGPALEYSYATRVSALQKLSSKEVFKLADENDPLAIAAIEYYRDHLISFLSNLSNFLDPHVIVLGGGMSLQKRIYSGISDRLSRSCFLTKNPSPVLPNECGDSAGALGAALLSLWN